MRKLVLAVVVISALLFCAPSVHAQVPAGCVLLTASGVQDGSGSGNLLGSGTITFTPKINYTTACNTPGQAGGQPFSTTVSNGSFAILMADGALTSPTLPPYAVVVTDSMGAVVLSTGYEKLQVAASGGPVSAGYCAASGYCNFDSFKPNIPAFTMVQTGPTGPQGVAGIGADAKCHADGNGNLVCGIVAATTMSTIPAGSGLIIAGDSRCAVSSSHTNWSDVVKGMSQFSGRIVEYQDTCIAGRTIEQMATAYSTDVLPLKPATTGISPTYLFVYVGTNDLSDGGIEDPATAYTNLAAYWAQAQTDGFTVVAFTEPMRGTTTAGAYTQNYIEQFNDLIRTAPVGSYAKLVDMALALPDPYNTNFFQNDFIHPTYPMGNYLEAAYVNYVFGGPRPGGMQSVFDGRRNGYWNYSCDITGLGLATTGAHNTACGIMSLQNVTTGGYNDAWGAYALNKLTIGTYNHAAGTQALGYVVDGSRNTVDGELAEFHGVSINDNSASGFEALFNNLSDQMTCIGSTCFTNNTTGIRGFAGGFQAGYNQTTGNDNAYIGYESGQQNQTGTDNSCHGSLSCLNNTVSGQTANGSNALFSVTTGSGNTADGTHACYSLTIGHDNYCGGGYAGYGWIDTTGSVAVGPNAGRFALDGTTLLTHSPYSVFIGENTEGTLGANNEIVIGQGAAGHGGNTVTLGNTSATNLYLGSVQICQLNGTGCPGGVSSLSGMTAGQVPIAATASTVTSSLTVTTAATASTIVERDASNNINASTFTGALSGNASTATTAGNLSGTPALPNGTTATTQAVNSADAKLATDNTVLNAFATPPTTGYGSTTPRPVASTVTTQSACATATTITTPCVVYSHTWSESTVTGSYATAFTTSAAGIYTIMGGVSATTLGGTTYLVNENVSTTLGGSPYGPNTVTLAQANITSGALTQEPDWTFNIAASIAIQTESATVSGTPGGAWNRWIVIMRVQ
jgi:lysophospholipase L1-like esterase